MNQDEYGLKVEQCLKKGDLVKTLIGKIGHVEFLLEVIRREHLITRAQCLQVSFDKMEDWLAGTSESTVPAIAELDGLLYENMTPQQLVDGWNLHATNNDIPNATLFKEEIKRRGIIVAVDPTGKLGLVKVPHVSDVAITEAQALIRKMDPIVPGIMAPHCIVVDGFYYQRMTQAEIKNLPLGLAIRRIGLNPGGIDNV